MTDYDHLPSEGAALLQAVIAERLPDLDLEAHNPRYYEIESETDAYEPMAVCWVDGNVLFRLDERRDLHVCAPLTGTSTVGVWVVQPDGRFVASNLLAKHDEKYMPPEMAGKMHETKTLVTDQTS